MVVEIRSLTLGTETPYNTKGLISFMQGVLT